MIKPPKGVEVKTNKTSTYWIEEDGILVSVTHEDAPKLTLEETKEQFIEFKKETGNKKLCMLFDAKKIHPTGKEEREYSGKVMLEITKAVAIITYNPLGRMLVNLFLGLKPPSYPIKMFGPDEVEKAREWLRKYL